MEMTYRPAANVLPEYTDEALRSETVYRGTMAQLLLTIPAEYRQPAAAEAFARSKRVTYHRVAGSDMLMGETCSIRNAGEALAEVLDEVLVQIRRTEVPTVDIAQLTEMLGLPADQQSAVGAWTGESDIWVSGTDGMEPNPRWTAAEAAELVRIWRRDAERITAAG